MQATSYYVSNMVQITKSSHAFFFLISFVLVGDLYSSGVGDCFCNMYSNVFMEVWFHDYSVNI